MSLRLRSTNLAAIFAVSASLWAAPVMATPGGGLKPLMDTGAAANSDVERVQYRNPGGQRAYGMRGGRRYSGYGGYGSRRNFGRNAGIGLGAAIIGGVVLSQAARSTHRRDHDGDWDRCAETYRSFEPSTGMYTGYDGVRRTCPYLN